MHIICLVKFVPDVSAFNYDYNTSSMVNTHTKMVLNPDDVHALSFALQVKRKWPETYLEVVSMASPSVTVYMHDLLRLSVDKGTLLSDPLYAGSDTYATSEVLGTYLKGQHYDCIITGSRSLDGATSQVPAQIAQMLGLDHLLDITEVDMNHLSSNEAQCTVETDTEIQTWSIQMPAVLSFARNSRAKLPYPTFEALQKDVSGKLFMISNQDLGLKRDSVGLEGSLTKVVHTYEAENMSRAKTVVGVNDEGIDLLVQFLEKRGYL
jgi:electron transfer flavoprotein beta subunit